MSEKERKLSPQEVKRKALFEEQTVTLEKQGYVRKDLTVSVVKANVMATIIMLPFILLFGGLFLYANQGQISFSISIINYLIFMSAILLLIVIHEGIHGLAWGLFAKGHFQSIEFGVIWEMLTPYCTCKEPLNKKQYIFGALLPTIVVGIIPAIIAIGMNHSVLILIALVMILCGGGDVFIVFKMIMHRENKANVIYIDHPYECGVVVFEKE